jgi:hypothetical protein
VVIQDDRLREAAGGGGALERPLAVQTGQVARAAQDREVTLEGREVRGSREGEFFRETTCPAGDRAGRAGLDAVPGARTVRMDGERIGVSRLAGSGHR